MVGGVKMENEEEYIEIAFRMKMSDYKKLPEEETIKMWEDSPDNISTLNIVGQIIVLGRGNYISDKCDIDE